MFDFMLAACGLVFLPFALYMSTVGARQVRRCSRRLTRAYVARKRG